MNASIASDNAIGTHALGRFIIEFIILVHGESPLNPFHCSASNIECVHLRLYQFGNGHTAARAGSADDVDLSELFQALRCRTNFLQRNIHCAYCMPFGIFFRSADVYERGVLGRYCRGRLGY